MNDPEIRVYPLHELSLAPNPRKRVTEQMVADRGASILEHGIIQPPLVRIIEGQPKIYAGQVRFRGLHWAVEKAKAESLPAHNPAKYGSRAEELTHVNVIVRDITHEQMIIDQCIENCQREDITPSEEADSYYELLETVNPETGVLFTVETLAAKLGFKPSRINDRLKLRNAPPKLLEAINGGMAIWIGIAVGRIPEPKERERAAQMILKPSKQEMPLNYEQTVDMISEHFMKSLKDPGFNPKDDSLLPPMKVDHHGVSRTCGGACTDCEFRSGNNPDLKNDLSQFGSRQGSNSGGGIRGIDPNLCTYPTCFRKKQQASWKIVKERAEDSNLRTLEGDAARKVFSGHEGSIAYDADYVDLDKKPRFEDLGNGYEQAPKWSKIIEQAAVPIVPALHPTTGKVHYLVDRKEAIKAAKAGDLSKNQDGVTNCVDAANEASKAEREKAKYETALATEGARELLEIIHQRGVGIDEQFLLFQIALDNAGADGAFFLGKLLEIKVEKGGQGRDYKPGIIEHVKAVATTKQSLEAFTALALLSKGMKWSGVRCDDYTDVAKAYGLKLKDLEVKVKALMKVGRKAKTQDPRLEDTRLEAAIQAQDWKTEDKRLEVWSANVPNSGKTVLASGTLEPLAGPDERRFIVEDAPSLKDVNAWQAATDDPFYEFGTEEDMLAYYQAGNYPFVEGWREKLAAFMSEPAAAPKMKERQAAPDREAEGLESYLKTGSLEMTVEETGIKLGTLQNWHKRRGWAKQRKEWLAANKA